MSVWEMAIYNQVIFRFSFFPVLAMYVYFSHPNLAVCRWKSDARISRCVTQPLNTDLTWASFLTERPWQSKSSTSDQRLQYVAVVHICTLAGDQTYSGNKKYTAKADKCVPV